MKIWDPLCVPEYLLKPQYDMIDPDPFWRVMENRNHFDGEQTSEVCKHEHIRT